MLADALGKFVTRVKRPIEMRDQLAGIDALHAGHGHLQVLEKAFHFASIRQRDERHALERRENEEMQTHPDRKVEVFHEGEHLAGGVGALQHAGPVGIGHLRKHRVAVLKVEHPAFHRNEDQVGVKPLDQVVDGVGEQCVILIGIEIGSCDTGLSYRRRQPAIVPVV